MWLAEKLDWKGLRHSISKAGSASIMRERERESEPIPQHVHTD